MATDMIEAEPVALSNAIFCFLSQNETQDFLPATDEELLIQTLDHLGFHYNQGLNDLVARGVTPKHDEQNLAQQFRKFTKAVKDKADEVKELNGGYKRLLAVPSFTLALVMGCRVYRHFKRAKWFKISKLNAMLETHGAVSK